MFPTLTTTFAHWRGLLAVFRRCYISGMVEFVLLSLEYDCFPYCGAPRSAQSDPGDARTVAPRHTSAWDAVFGLWTK